METIDLTSSRLKDREERDYIHVIDMSEMQRKALTIAKEIERSGRRVSSREIGTICYGEETNRNAQKAACTISGLKRRGLWPYRQDGSNGVPTTKRLIWPDPVESAPPPPSPDRTFALSVLRQFLELSEAAQERSWPHVRGMVDAVLERPIEAF